VNHLGVGNFQEQRGNLVREGTDLVDGNCRVIEVLNRLIDFDSGHETEIMIITS
jgi:hypothetical protein